MNANVIARDWFARRPEEVARDLIGQRLVRTWRGERMAGLIVETEAYLASDDAASHAARGKTRSNAAMFAQPGTSYVYPIHAKFCFNVVTEASGIGSAVLIRALEPVDGVKAMLRHRPISRTIDLTNGPAKLCQALRITRSLDHHDLTRGEQLWIEATDTVRWPIVITPRIGVTSAAHLPLRFVAAEHPWASGSRRLNRHGD